MKKKKIFILLLLLVVIFFNIFLAYIFFYDSDDFYPHTEKEYYTDYSLSSDLLNLSQLKTETTQIAQTYESGLVLTEITYFFYDKNNGIIILNFYKGFSGKNKVCTLEFKIDILTKKLYYVLYQKGHGKSLAWNGNEITADLQTDLFAYIDSYQQNFSINILNNRISAINVLPTTITKFK